MERRSRRVLLLAVEDEVVLAVGGVKDTGEITLNYVSPRTRFRGASSVLLNALEARAAERGATTCTLLSTETAHRFYLARSYVDMGAPQRKHGSTASHPMAKRL